MKMEFGKPFWATVIMGGMLLPGARADERRFTYSYEPETMPQGGMEFEQWITLRTQRTKGGEVKQGNYNLWEIREEFEYGLTDRYTASLYLNTAAESFRDYSQDPPTDKSSFKFKGISIENRYMVWNPAEHGVGLTLYLEPRYSGDEAEIEEKLILGQRFGEWKWAFNVPVPFSLCRDWLKRLGHGLSWHAPGQSVSEADPAA